MNDQATTLRRMSALTINLGEPEPVRQVRTIAIASGKGGVGKTNIAVNVAIELAALGRKVSLLDADLSLANADVILGLNPKYHLGHVLTGQKELEDVVITLANGLRLIPGGSGVEQLANLPIEAHTRYVNELNAIEADSNYFIVDSAAGIAGNVTGVLRAATEIIVVTTPEPTAMVDAYATIKVAHQYSPNKLIWVVINNANGVGYAQQAFKQLFTAAQRFLPHNINYLGTIPHDEVLADAVRERSPVVEFAPNAPSSRSLRLIARALDRSAEGNNLSSSSSFWEVLTESEV